MDSVGRESTSIAAVATAVATASLTGIIGTFRTARQTHRFFLLKNCSPLVKKSV
jgi:hypothetical protein